MNVFLQIGAGAGDLDIRANLKDGFTEYVKKFATDNCRILLVEPNPINIPYLKECWSSYPQAEIYPIGICLESSKSNFINFYYADEDAPNFQVFSMNRLHVEKHYPGHQIKEKTIECLTLLEFINNHIGLLKIEMLALDIEGIDSDILIETDFNLINCKYLSFEYLHLGNKEKIVFDKLSIAGYLFVGNGLDHNGYDYLFRKINSKIKFIPFLKVINNLLLFIFKLNSIHKFNLFNSKLY